MTAVWSAAVGTCLVTGLFFNTMGVLGILRFPDVYTRLHADTKATTFGSIFLALAAVLVAVREGVLAGAAGWGAWGNVAVHIAFAVVVLLVTNATGGHAIARAAWRAGHRPAEAVVDALAAANRRAAAGEPQPQAIADDCNRLQSNEIGEAPDAPETSDAPEPPEAADAPEAVPQAAETGEEAEVRP